MMIMMMMMMMMNRYIKSSIKSNFHEKIHFRMYKSFNLRIILHMKMSVDFHQIL